MNTSFFALAGVIVALFLVFRRNFPKTWKTMGVLARLALWGWAGFLWRRPDRTGRVRPTPPRMRYRE